MQTSDSCIFLRYLCKRAFSFNGSVSVYGISHATRYTGVYIEFKILYKIICKHSEIDKNNTLPNEMFFEIFQNINIEQYYKSQTVINRATFQTSP